MVKFSQKIKALTSLVALLSVCCFALTLGGCGNTPTESTLSGDFTDSSMSETPGNDDAVTEDPAGNEDVSGDETEETGNAANNGTTKTPTSSNTPGNKVTQTPGNKVTQTPGNKVTQTPGNKVTQTPGNKVTQTPGNKVTQTPGNKVTQTPGNKVTQAPGNKTTNAVQKTTTTTRNTATSKDVDVTGYTFTLNNEWFPSKITKTSTTFEKMLVERIEEVEEELGCTIKIVNNFYVGMDSMSPLIMAGRKVADVIVMMPRQITPIAGNKFIVDLSKVDGIDINDPKWLKPYTELGTLNGKVYGLNFMRPTEVRYCVMFNKTLLSNNGVDVNGLYDLVRSGKWTFEKLAEYAQKATTVVNGVTRTWGVGGPHKYVLESLLGANNAKLVTLGKSGASITMNSKQAIEAVNFFSRLVNTDKSFMITDGMRTPATFSSSEPDFTSAFMKGTLGFLIEDSWILNQKVKLKVKNFDWGLLPLPIGPSASSYVSPSANAQLYCITSTNKADLPKTVKIFNAIAEPLEGYDNGDWWYDDIQEDYFQSNDKDSLDMYKICFNNMTYDPGTGVESLMGAFMQVSNNAVFFNKETVDVGIKSITGTYDKAVAATFKGIYS